MISREHGFTTGSLRVIQTLFRFLGVVDSCTPFIVLDDVQRSSISLSCSVSRGASAFKLAADEPGLQHPLVLGYEQILVSQPLLQGCLHPALGVSKSERTSEDFENGRLVYLRNGKSDTIVQFGEKSGFVFCGFGRVEEMQESSGEKATL